jgi:cell division protein FtsN
MGSNPVNGNGAIWSEMNEVALFQSALRVAVPTRPDPRIGVELVPRLAQVARAATIEVETQASRRGSALRSGRGRRALVARVAIVVGLIPLVLAGLAFAGVTVPAPARDAFDSLGITLPNQPSEHAQSDQATPESTQGGNDVSDAAKTKPKGQGGNSAAAHEHARKQHEKAKGKAKGHDKGKAIGLNDLTPPGESQETGPPEHSNSGGSAQSQSVRPAPKPHPNPFPQANARGGGQSEHSK